MTIEDTSAKTDVLSMKRSYNAPTKKVFEAWTKVEFLSKWWGPPGSEIKDVDLDLHVGGRYRIRFQQPDGLMISVTGIYKEISPTDKLSFTWRWENKEMDIGYSLVTLEFIEEGEGTTLTLTHELLPTLEARIQHEQGWGGFLDKLTDFVE